MKVKCRWCPTHWAIDYKKLEVVEKGPRKKRRIPLEEARFLGADSLLDCMWGDIRSHVLIEHPTEAERLYHWIDDTLKVPNDDGVGAG
jgi:hypothetical protein